MIVPQGRLLFWIATVILPFGTLAGVYDPAALLSFAIIGLLLVVVLADAFMSFSSVKGLSLNSPPVVRGSKDREAKIEIQITNLSQKPRHLRMGLGLPMQIETRNEIVDVALPNTERSKLAWAVIGRRRGNFRITRAYIEAPSPLGFWAFRTALALDCQIRVYPNLLSERKNMAALFLNRGSFGLHAQRQIGKGRDFEKLREYSPGDSYDEIHWKATAKRGHSVTKVFQIERTQEIYVLIDASRLSARRVHSVESPAGVSVLERYITAALVLGLAAERQGDLFGLLTFSDKVESFVRAKNGPAHYHACRDAIYALEPRAVTPDYDELASFVRLRLRRRALLLVLTALDDPVLAESFVRNMDLICRQHLVVVNMLKPPGADPLFTHLDVRTNDDLYEELRGHLQWQKLRELKKVLQRRGVDLSLLENERLSAELVSQYMNVKQRQAL